MGFRKRKGLGGRCEEEGSRKREKGAGRGRDSEKGKGHRGESGGGGKTGGSRSWLWV